MIVQTGSPEESGRYVCYLPGVKIATVSRFWLVGRGWLDNLQEPIKGDVAGFIGPLPNFEPEAVEYDL